MAEKKERRLTQKQEAFAQACVSMSTSTLSDVYRAVYKVKETVSPKTVWRNAVKVREDAKVSSKIDELKAQTTAKTQLTRAWVLENLMEHALECRGKKKVMVTKDGADVEIVKRDEAAANRAMELLGKELRMFVDRKEIGAPGEFAALDEDKLDAFIENAMEELKQVSAVH
jgi:Fe2+ or Zn2+ uptake regulation protein